jgi:hypothetical protein
MIESCSQATEDRQKILTKAHSHRNTVKFVSKIVRFNERID